MKGYIPYQNGIQSTIDYYPFGMEIPGRMNPSSGSSYRFGMNGQMKDNEFTGQDGAHTTAMFWEYDSRIGRRWNRDIEYQSQAGWSPYRVFLDNPNVYSDPPGSTEFLTIIITDKATGHKVALSMATRNDVFSNGKIHTSQDGSYHMHWYDKQVAYNYTLNADGSVEFMRRTSSLVNKTRVTTYGPTMENPDVANAINDFNELVEGDGGVQKGGFYLTTPEGGANPAKWKSLTDAEQKDAEVVLLTLSGLGQSKYQFGKNNLGIGKTIKTIKGVLDKVQQKEGSSQDQNNNSEKVIDVGYIDKKTGFRSCKGTIKKDSARTADSLKKEGFIIN